MSDLIRDKDFVTKHRASSMDFKFYGFPGRLSLMGTTLRFVQVMLHTHQLYIRSKEPKYMESKFFIWIHWVEANLPAVALERDYIFIILKCKTACPLLQREALSSKASKAALYINLCEKTAQSKGPWFLCWQNVLKHEMSMETFIPISSEHFRDYIFSH